MMSVHLPPTGDALLQVDDLVVTLPLEHGRGPVLRGVSFSIRPGEALGLVGESGSGKSMTAKAITRLLPPRSEMSGSIRFEGADVNHLRGSALRMFRQRACTIFQDPRAHINPLRRIGDFMTEALRTNRRMSPGEAARRAVDQLAAMGVHDGERRLRQYPHELSGGLLQRVMIATALLTDPVLLVADEPTTALDVTTQSDVMAILDELRRDRALAMLFITHDLELASAVCDRIAVMYAGEIVELRGAADLEDAATHPYTVGLMSSRPSIDRQVRRLQAIPGRPLSAFEAPGGCAFSSRCAHRIDDCLAEPIPLQSWGSGAIRCIRAHDLSGSDAAHG